MPTVSIAWILRRLPRVRPIPARTWAASLAALWLAFAVGVVRADGLELTSFDLRREEEGLLLDYTARIELPRAVEDALQKGVPIYFVAQAAVFNPRWYWRDKRIARVARNWRLTWQPLTRRYRINLGSVSQGYDSLADALGAIQRATRWKLADAAALDEGERLYVEFSLKLDTSQLPRPLQIGFGGDADWDLALERTAPVPATLAPH